MAAKKSVSIFGPAQAAPAKPATVVTAERVSVAHGPYLIVAGRRNDKCAAIGYLGSRRIEERGAPTVDDAVAAVKAALDERASGLKTGRSGDVPTADEFREALGALYPKLPDRMQTMLATHCRLPGSAATLAELASRFEISENTVKVDYGKLARGLAKLLGFAPGETGLDRKLTPLLSLATISFKQAGRPILHLRPELVGALRAMQQIQA